MYLIKMEVLCQEGTLFSVVTKGVGTCVISGATPTPRGSPLTSKLQPQVGGEGTGELLCRKAPRLLPEQKHSLLQSIQCKATSRANNNNGSYYLGGYYLPRQTLYVINTHHPSLSSQEPLMLLLCPFYRW